MTGAGQSPERRGTHVAAPQVSRLPLPPEPPQEPEPGPVPLGTLFVIALLLLSLLGMWMLVLGVQQGRA